jgi:hypothetical protein
MLITLLGKKGAPMTLEKACFISMVSSLVLVGVARVLIEFEFTLAAFVLFPGGMVDILRTRSVHGGFRGFKSEITTEGVSFIVWFGVILLILGLFEIARRYSAKKNA